MANPGVASTNTQNIVPVQAEFDVNGKCLGLIGPGGVIFYPPTTLNVINGSTSGAITLAVPAVAGTNTATFPAATGTVMVSGNMPAFSAYFAGTQNISSGAFTKIQLNSKEFDTANAFDSTTNYRFQPLVAGYYQINGQIDATSTGTLTRIVPAMYKNGSGYKYGIDITAADTRANVSSLVYLNGSTDYIELYALLIGTGTLSLNSGGITDNYLNGSMVRSA